MNKKLTTSEAAERLGVSSARVRRLVLDGRLPAEKFGRDLSFNETDIRAFKKLKGGRPPKEGKQKPASTPKRATGQKNASNGPSSKKGSKK